MKKSIGLIALCALISPSVAMAQAQATLDATISMEQASASVTVDGIYGVSFGEVIIPRSNGSAAAVCRFNVTADNTVSAVTIDPDGALSSDCEVQSGAEPALFSIACASSQPINISVAYDTQSKSFSTLTPSFSPPSMIVSDTVIVAETEGDQLDLDCSELDDGQGLIDVGAGLLLNIESLEQTLFAETSSVFDYVLGTVTVSADF